MEEREMQILLEAMNRQFALVMEGLAALSAKIDEFGQRLGAMIDHNSLKLDMLIEKLDAIAAKHSVRGEG